MNEAPPEYNLASMTVFSSTFGGREAPSSSKPRSPATDRYPAAGRARGANVLPRYHPHNRRDEPAPRPQGRTPRDHSSEPPAPMTAFADSAVLSGFVVLLDRIAGRHVNLLQLRFRRHAPLAAPLAPPVSSVSPGPPRPTMVVVSQRPSEPAIASRFRPFSRPMWPM